MADKLPKDEAEQILVNYWSHKFKESMVAKAPYIKRWNSYIDAYNGDYFKNESVPEYKSDLVSNYIFSTIETIRPIMLDNDPKFQAMPRQPNGLKFSTDLNEVLLYEWDRNNMNTKLYRELITSLTLGTSVFFVPWNSETKQVDSIPVSPFNIFPDPLATSVEDSEYIIYASYMNDERLRRMFPEKEERLIGSSINYSELVFDNNDQVNVNNQILVLEIWTRDYETFEDPDSSSKDRKRKHPDGRVITMCPEIGVVLSDRRMPYDDKEFPFVLLKDYDVPGKFWGEGEVAQLISPQKHMNDLNNAILDNAKATANMPWIVDKNSGIAQGQITNRPGLIIRKNPGTDVRREQPPSMPGYVINAVTEYKQDMEQISGIFDSLKGNSATGVYTAQGILALQEAGQARIRLKVKIMEEFLGKLARMWYSRMRQFWKDDRWLRIAQIDGTYDFKNIKKQSLEHDYDIKIMAGSTMPVNRGAMLDLMIRLAQTQMPDGQTLVDREAVVEYLPSEIKSTMLQRMEEGQQPMEVQMQQVMEQIGQQFEQIGQQFDQVSQDVAQMGQQIGELSQGLEQLAEESKANDEQTMDVVDQLVDAIDKINDDIIQLKEEANILEEEEARQAEIDRIKEDAYNSGYKDAESYDTFEGEPLDPLNIGEQMESGEDIDPVEIGEGLEEEPLGEGIPDDILEGIEGMSDEELALLLQSNPELGSLLE